MAPLINPSLIAAVSPQVSAASQSNARKANAEAYAAAAREAAGPAQPQARVQAAAAETGRNVIAREAPFGAERPRYQRPGTLLDIRV
jgi:hypothetical protein